MDYSHSRAGSIGLEEYRSPTRFQRPWHRSRRTAASHLLPWGCIYRALQYLSTILHQSGVLNLHSWVACTRSHLREVEARSNVSKDPSQCRPVLIMLVARQDHNGRKHTSTKQSGTSEYHEYSPERSPCSPSRHHTEAVS